MSLNRFLFHFVSLVLLGILPTASMSSDAPGQINNRNFRQLSNDLYVIEDKAYVPAVPNVVFVVGSEAVLIVESGINPSAGRKILSTARKLAGKKKIYITFTHFHPEHGFGAVVFKGAATIVYNDAQYREFLEKRDNYVTLFTRLGVGSLVQNTKFVSPDMLYSDHLELNLGDRAVEFYSGHGGHTRGDQIIYVPGDKAALMGDLLETSSFPILPWYPEIHDTDVSPAKWLETLQWVSTTLHPEIVIPGHGPVGTEKDIQDLSAYFEFVRDDVIAQCKKKNSLSLLQDDMEPILRKQYPNWHLSEWIRPGMSAFAKDYCPSLLN